MPHNQKSNSKFTNPKHRLFGIYEPKTSLKEIYEPGTTSLKSTAMTSQNVAQPETKEQVVCFAIARNNTKKDAIHEDFEMLVDQESSVYRKCKYTDSNVPQVTDLLELAKQIQGFQIQEGKVFCPVVVVSEHGDYEIAASKMDITFGSHINRAKMMTSVNIKRDILKKLQGVESVDDINKDEYKGLMVGLKGIETLVLMPLQHTEMRQKELEQAAREQGQENDRDVHHASDRYMRKRATKLLIALRDHIHTFDQETAYGFKTNVVIGHSQKITQSQVSVSKLLWRGLFEGHKDLMKNSILEMVFQVRHRKRDRPTEAGKTPEWVKRYYPSTAGKQAVKTVPKTASVPTDAMTNPETMQRILIENIESRTGEIGDATARYLTTFLKTYLTCVSGDDFIQHMTEAAQQASPEDVLLTSIPGILESTQSCSDLKKELESICIDMD